VSEDLIKWYWRVVGGNILACPFLLLSIQEKIRKALQL
jgi:hypothetical protein